MKKNNKKFTSLDKNYTLTIASVLTVWSLLITAYILITDLLLVLTSYGSWSIFGQKIIIAFIFNIALIATIRGNVGIDTKWMYKSYTFKLKRIIFNIVIYSVMIVLIGIWTLVILMINNQEYSGRLLIGMVFLFGVSLVSVHVFYENKEKALHSVKYLWTGIKIGLFIFMLIFGGKYIQNVY